MFLRSSDKPHLLPLGERKPCAIFWDQHSRPHLWNERRKEREMEKEMEVWQLAGSVIYLRKASVSGPDWHRLCPFSPSPISPARGLPCLPWASPNRCAVCLPSTVIGFIPAPRVCKPC